MKQLGIIILYIIGFKAIGMFLHLTTGLNTIVAMGIGGACVVLIHYGILSLMGRFKGEQNEPLR